MTRDIDQLSKVAEKFDKSGLFSSSEVVDGLIKHLASKLTNDEYRALTKTYRDSFKTKEVKADDMIETLLKIAAQFDAEGNFSESDRITATVETMLKKKVKLAGVDLSGFEEQMFGRTRSEGTCTACGKDIDMSDYSEEDKRECEITGCCRECTDFSGIDDTYEPNPYDPKSEDLIQYQKEDGDFDFDRYLEDHKDWPSVGEHLGKVEWDPKLEPIYELPKDLFDEWVNEQAGDDSFPYDHAYYQRERYLAFKEEVEDSWDEK